MGEHVDREDHVAAARELDIVEVLHLLVVEQAVAADDAGRGVLRRGGLGHQEIGVDGVAVGGVPLDLGHLDGAAGGLDRGDADAADQAEHQRDAEPDFYGFVHIRPFLSFLPKGERRGFPAPLERHGAVRPAFLVKNDRNAKTEHA